MTVCWKNRPQNSKLIQLITIHLSHTYTSILLTQNWRSAYREIFTFYITTKLEVIMKSQNFTDYELVQSFVNGNQIALETLLHRHKSKLYGYIFKLVKNEALTEDIFQDTFVKAINSLRAGAYKDEGRFSAWILRIAHNLVIDHYRRQKNFRVVSNDSSETDYFNSEKFAFQSIDKEMAETQVSEELKELIAELPDDQRSIIKMRLTLKMSFKEIAEFYDISINTALGRMRYAVINLRKRMKEKEYSLMAEY